MSVIATKIDAEILGGMAASGIPPVTDRPPMPNAALLASMRANMAKAPFPECAPGIMREELRIPGPDDGPPVAVRIYRRESRAATAVPGLIWMHAGGYVLGSYEMDQPLLEPLVAKTGCVAISVNYRLAPETPYPGPVGDCFAALRFLFENSRELGVDASRLVVGGISSGGGLAAAVALIARDQAIPLAHQHLIYPMIDDTQTSVSSQWDQLAIWSREMNGFAWRCYLGSLYGRADVPPYAAPTRAADLSGLPPTYIHVGALDGFLHEDVHYASRLLAAGIPTELHVFPAAPHGFDIIAPDATVSKIASRLSDEVLTRVLTP